jgi:hypothetical protein
MTGSGGKPQEGITKPIDSNNNEHRYILFIRASLVSWFSIDCLPSCVHYPLAGGSRGAIDKEQLNSPQTISKRDPNTFTSRY